MILDTASNNPPPSLTANNNQFERLTYFKLLGINISNNIRWVVHVDALCAKVASGIAFS